MKKIVILLLLSICLLGCAQGSVSQEVEDPGRLLIKTGLENVRLEYIFASEEVLNFKCDISLKLLREMGISKKTNTRYSCGLKIGSQLKFLVEGENEYGDLVLVKVELPYKVSSAGKADCLVRELFWDAKKGYYISERISQNRHYAVIKRIGGDQKVKLWGAEALDLTGANRIFDEEDNVWIRRRYWEIIGYADPIIFESNNKTKKDWGLVIRNSKLYMKPDINDGQLGVVPHSTSIAVKREVGEFLELFSETPIFWLFMKSDTINLYGEVINETADVYNRFDASDSKVMYSLEKGDKVKIRFHIKGEDWYCIAPTDEMSCFIKKENVRWPIR